MFSTSRALRWHSTADKSVCTQQRALKGDTRPFTPINKAELMAFIGLNIAMGIVSLPAIRNWWNLGTPLVSHSNEQKSFYGSSAKLPCGWQHNSSQSTDPNYNTLWKIQPIITALNETSAQMYKPHCQLSVDESMIGTKCRLSFIQYMKAKLTKWGVKVWVCSDAVTGYIYSRIKGNCYPTMKGEHKSSRRQAPELGGGMGVVRGMSSVTLICNHSQNKEWRVAIGHSSLKPWLGIKEYVLLVGMSQPSWTSTAGTVTEGALPWIHYTLTLVVLSIHCVGVQRTLNQFA